MTVTLFIRSKKMKIEDLVEIHLSKYSDKFCIYTEKELENLNDVGM